MLVLEIIACESTPIYNFWCEDILEIAVKLHLTVFCGILFVVLHYSCTVGFCLFWWRVSLEFTCRRKRKVMQDLLYEFSRTINCRRRNTCVMRIHLETTKQVQILLKRHESKWWRWGEWEMLFCMLCVCLSFFFLLHMNLGNLRSLPFESCCMHNEIRKYARSSCKDKKTAGGIFKVFPLHLHA